MTYATTDAIIAAVRDWQHVSARVATHPQPLSLMTDLRKAENKLRALRLPPEEEAKESDIESYWHPSHPRSLQARHA